MQLKRVESEMLEAVGYDPNGRVLEVIFNGGDTNASSGAILTSVFETGFSGFAGFT